MTEGLTDNISKISRRFSSLSKQVKSKWRELKNTRIEPSKVCLRLVHRFQRVQWVGIKLDVREKLKDPVLRDDLPEDLVDLLYNLKENA